MKKLFIILALVVVVLAGRLTACERHKAEADVKKSEVDVIVEKAINSSEELLEEVIPKYTVRVVKAEMDLLIADFLTYYEVYGWSEEMTNDIVELCENIEYNESFEYGFDIVKWQIDFVNIMVEHGFLPEECEGLTFEELEQIEGIEEYL